MLSARALCARNSPSIREIRYLINMEKIVHVNVIFTLMQQLIRIDPVTHTYLPTFTQTCFSILTFFLIQYMQVCQAFCNKQPAFMPYVHDSNKYNMKQPVLSHSNMIIIFDDDCKFVAKIMKNNKIYIWKFKSNLTNERPIYFNIF